MNDPISTLFLDVGGVLLTDGWGHASRQQAAKYFGLNYSEMQARHEVTFDTYEMDRMSFDSYLNLTVFYEPRLFTKQEFISFMFSCSKALPGHIEFFRSLKDEHKLRVIAVSNESRELNEYRIQTFGLDALFDAYATSCYVHLHKPDTTMLKLACDISHTLPANALYIDDRPLLVDVGRNFGVQTHHFRDLGTMQKFLEGCSFLHAA